MPHPNLYGVTASLRELLRVNVWRLSGQVITVSDLPPEEAEKETTLPRLNIYLYHAMEDPHRRNAFPADDAGSYPISRTPLPLTLYYVLTAHSIVADKIDAPGQQLLMGLGMKSLHDFPVIDDALELHGPPLGSLTHILEPTMRSHQNRIEIVARPITPEETVTFWSASQNHTARLTAYYEVRSLLMPPEEPAGKPGIVTALALGVSPFAKPTLYSSQSIQTFTLPALSGGATLSNSISPGVATLGAVGPPPGNRVILTGESLGDGTDERIVLSSAGFAALVPPVAEAVIDPASNPAWMFQFKPDGLEFTVQPDVNIEIPGGFRNIPIRPGIYAIAVRRNKQLSTAAGATSFSAVDSNHIAFAVGPLVTLGAVAGARVRFTLDSNVVCNDSLNQPALAIGGQAYRFVPAFTGDPLQDPGTFIAFSATQYEADPLFNPNDGATRMVRVAVNGVDAPPFWLEP